MELPGSDMPESGSKHHAYCRKQKSLGLLCSNFLSLYDREGVESIGLDDAAHQLGVERRRIYDIVNVLESVGVLARKAKNQYSWKGFGAIPKALEELKQEGLRENYHLFDGKTCPKVPVEDEDETYSNHNTSSQEDQPNPSTVSKSSASSKADNRREKSLGVLTQNFVKLFLCSKADSISLDEAARILLGDAHTSSIMRNNSAAKVRRLYDIANVFSSMNLIQKTHHAETRKPAFRWLGMRGRLRCGSVDALELTKPKKRVFGAEITNSSSKRSKVDSSRGGSFKQNLIMQMPVEVKHESLENVVDRSNLEEETKLDLKTYKFGPFAPASVPKVCAPQNNKMKRVHDWETLSTAHRPQYHNEALNDLFVHYMEAWKSWYYEVAGEQPLEQVS